MEKESFNLNKIDLKVLNILSRGELNISTLTKKVGIANKNMWKKINKLEKLGFIEKNKQLNSNFKNISITHKGSMQLLATTTEYWRKHNIRLVNTKDLESIKTDFNNKIESIEKQIKEINKKITS